MLKIDVLEKNDKKSYKKDNFEHKQTADNY